MPKLFIFCHLFVLLIGCSDPLQIPNIKNLKSSVEQGKYLAQLGNCYSCHTASNDKPFAGGVAFHTEYGTLYSTNITMDMQTGIGSWQFADFYRAMKEGIRPDGKHLYPAFPYTNFAKLSDNDLGSLWLYVQQLENQQNTITTNDLKFPFNQRWLLATWKVLYHSNNPFVANEDKTSFWNRGAYLVDGLAHCSACHTPRNILGAEKTDLAFSGARIYDRVKTGQIRAWSSSNLTPDHQGIDNWSEQDIVDYLTKGSNRHSVVHGPMNEVVVNSTSFASKEDLFAIANYLSNLKPINISSEPSMRHNQGETLYTIHCGSCHLADGKGDDILGVSLANNAVVQNQDPATLINVILYGPHLPRAPFITDRSRMKMLGKRLSDEEIADIASYIRGNFDNRASLVTASEVAAQR
jgi:mono/diheme cytochrome c family protein